MQVCGSSKGYARWTSEKCRCGLASPCSCMGKLVQLPACGMYANSASPLYGTWASLATPYARHGPARPYHRGPTFAGTRLRLNSDSMSYHETSNVEKSGLTWQCPWRKMSHRRWHGRYISSDKNSHNILYRSSSFFLFLIFFTPIWIWYLI